MSQGVPGIPGVRGKVGARGPPVSENKMVYVIKGWCEGVPKRGSY